MVWANEVHRLLTNYSTSCYQTCRWWHVRVSAGQRASASARKTIELLERKTPYFIPPDLWPPISPNVNLVDYKLWGIMQQQSSRRRSRMWMNSRSNWLKPGLVWNRTLCMEKPSVCLCSHKGPTYRTLTVAVEQRDIWINFQPEWPKCEPNVIYACYFNKVTILPYIKCNISLVLFSPGSVEADIGWGAKLNSHLMASCFRNICAKNRQNPLILFSRSYCYTVWSAIGISLLSVRLSVRPSVCPSVCLWRCALWLSGLV